MNFDVSRFVYWTGVYNIGLTLGVTLSAFGLIVHHDDGKREFAYDRQSIVGKLDKALDEATQRGWTVVSMGKDWRQVFAFQK